MSTMNLLNTVVLLLRKFCKKYLPFKGQLLERPCAEQMLAKVKEPCTIMNCSSVATKHVFQGLPI
eukprot:1092426-Amphidinium_carterae.1